jgi:transposase-like protein
MTRQVSSANNGIASRTPETSSPEIHPNAERRTRTAAEKLRILQEYDTAPVGSPERGALLRREGIYTSQISKWRKLRDRGLLGALAPQRRGPKAAPRDPLQEELEQLRKENARLQTRLTRAEAIIEVQKKVAQLLGTAPPSPPSDEL